MDASRIARRNRRRPGFRLIDYDLVALPVYSLSLRVITLAHKKVPPIEEFVLRSVAAGMNSQDDVAAFLGLQPSVVRAALISLAQSESLALAGVPGSRAQTLLMTQKGRAVLHDSELVVPEERSFTLHFDGLLRKVQLLGWTELLQPKEIRDRGLVEIPSFPARKPVVSDLKLPEVEQVIRSMGNVGDQRRDLLAIRGIERATRLFREAVALVYVADREGEVQIAFDVDGKISEAHERAFALAGGIKKIGLNTGELFADDVLQWSDLDPAILNCMAKEDPLEVLHDEIAKAENTVEQRARDLEMCESVQAKVALSAQLDEARLIRADKIREMENFRVRELACYDCPQLFEDALASAKKRLTIVSRKVTAKVLSLGVVKKLQDLLNSGVKISITLEDSSTEGQKRDYVAVQHLQDLADNNKRMLLVRRHHIHRSLLSVDDAFVAVGMFDWLGYTGNPNRSFSRRQSVLIRDPEKVREILSRFDVVEE